MQIFNNSQRYGLVTKTLHWFMFVVIIFLLLMHQLGHIFPRGSEERFFVIWLHQSLGITMFFLVILRLAWRFFNKTPDYPSTMPAWQKKLSGVVHWILYIGILIQPIAGVMMVRANGREPMFWNLRLPPFEQANEQIANIAWFIHFQLLGHALQLFVAFHIVAALYHHFIVKDNVLKKMGWGV